MSTFIPFIGGNNSPFIVTQPGDYTVGLLALTSGGQAQFVGPGTYNVTVLAALDAVYTIEATGGAVVNFQVDGALFTSPTVVIDGPSTVSFVEEYSALSPVTVNFQGAGGGNLILPPGRFEFGDGLTTVNNFSLHDTIDFNTPFESGDQYVYNSTGPDVGTLALEDSTGKVLGQVLLNGNFTQGDFSISEGPNGTASLVCDIPCFLPGTLIATPSGEVAVESLRAGDLVLTHANGAQPVAAVRSRTLEGEAELTSDKLRPVRIAADALGEGLPRRDLWVSPDHSMFIDDVLVPAQLLVNGVTITQPENHKPVTYVHVELQPHEVIFAEGAATETFLDTGNGRLFQRPGVVTLFGNAEPKSWEDACAPILLAGPRLNQIRARLLARVTAGDEALAKVA